MSEQTILEGGEQQQADKLPCVCHLRFKHCVGNCDWRNAQEHHKVNSESFKELALEIGADHCFTSGDFYLEFPSPLTSEKALRIVRWCGVRNFGYVIAFNVDRQRTCVTVHPYMTPELQRKSEYIPYGAEWVKEMEKWRKSDLINLLGKTFRELREIESKAKP